jgi:hypothetical protein
MDRLAVWHWFAFGHFVIDPFPLALDLDATLRRWMAEANSSNTTMRTEASLYAGVSVTASVWLLVRRFTGLSDEFIGI